MPMLTDTAAELYHYMNDLDVVDAHEHLRSEDVYLEQGRHDVFSFLTQYTCFDLKSAGMDDQAFSVIRNADLSLSARWDTFEPYWNAVRHGSYARCAIETAKSFYQVDQVDGAHCGILNDRIVEAHKPGLYGRVHEQGRICATITLCGDYVTNDNLFAIMPILDGIGYVHHRTPIAIAAQAEALNLPPVQCLEEYITMWKTMIRQWHRDGIIGIKIQSKYIEPPDHEKGACEFDRMMAGEAPVYNDMIFNHLDNIIIQESIALAGELGLIVATHSGVWRDYRAMDSKHMLVLAREFPEATFDLFHLGMPDIRDTLMVGKNHPNVILNLCWSHIVSPEQCIASIGELLDQVPVNKVIAFGGDFVVHPELLLGHLTIAQENFARAFAQRIQRGWMSTSDAKDIIKMWFSENALRVYGIDKSTLS